MMTSASGHVMQGFVKDSRTINLEDYKAFQQFLKDACGIVLGDNKEYLVTSRLSGVMAEHGHDSLKGLLQELKRASHSRLKTIVVDAMTTNETFWFRDMAHFRILSEKILPELSGKGRPVRIWSAACSSGQEPYSISMISEDYKNRKPGQLAQGIEVVATDISTKIVAEAKAGIYCGTSVSRGLSAQQRDLYFTPIEECLQVNENIRQNVTFRELNLTNNFSSLGRFDMIFCRNVLIYFSGELKQDIIKRMSQALNPGGYLFLGSAEALNGFSDTFEMVANHGGIVYRLKS